MATRSYLFLVAMVWMVSERVILLVESVVEYAPRTGLMSTYMVACLLFIIITENRWISVATTYSIVRCFSCSGDELG